jgi:MFS family permease
MKQFLVISPALRPLVPLYFTMLLEAVGSGLVASILSLTAREDLGCSNMQVGIIWSSYNAASIVGSVCMGYVSDHIRRKYVLMLTFFWVSMGYILTAFSNSFEWLLVSRIVTGMCGGSFSIAASILSSNLASDMLPFAIGRLGTVGSLGFSIGPLISLAITSIWNVSADSPFYVRRIYFFCASLIYLLAGFLASCLSKSLTPRNGSLASSCTQGGRISPGICLIWSSRFFSTCGLTAIYVTQVFLWVEFLGLDRASVSLATTASGLVVSIFQAFAFPFLVARIGFHATLSFGIGLIATSCVLMGALTSGGSVAVHFLVLVVFWLGISCMEPGTPVAVAGHLKQSQLLELSPIKSTLFSLRMPIVHTGLAMGITSAMKYAASLAMPPVAGYLYDHFKLMVYYCAAGVASLGVVVVFIAWRLYDNRQTLVPVEGEEKDIEEERNTETTAIDE